MGEQSQPIAYVLRGSTTGFVCGTRVNRLGATAFGRFVRVTVAEGGETVLGLIYGIRIDDDPLVRQLVLAEDVPESTVNDQRVNRMVPVEISVLNVGYRDGRGLHHSLPPRPPLSLHLVFMCDDAEVIAFTRELSFFRLVLNAPDVPSEDLLAAALGVAADVRESDARMQFLIDAGRELARLLNHDPRRLENILRLIKPEEVSHE